MDEKTVGDVSTRNDSETRRADTGNRRGIGSGSVRYRFTDAAGKSYAPFRLRPGFAIRDVIAVAYPDGAQDDADWALEKA